MNRSIELLLSKFLANEADVEELSQLEEWIQDKDNEVLFLEYVKLNAQINNVMNNYDNKKATKEAIRRRIKEARRPKFKLLKYAAVIVLAFTLGYVYHNYNTGAKETLQFEEPIIVDNQIEIGTDKATLTLSNGEQVALAKGTTVETENATSNGEEIEYNKTASNAIAHNTLTIPRGGQFQIVLSDGTKVWLNSETQLKYPVAFVKGNTRKVELIYGEAYFEVSPSSAHQGTKFKVYHEQQEVEVLGTQFNVKAYADEINVYTTLVEGKVSILAAGENKLLVPGEQANVDLRTSTLSVAQVNVYNEVSWKEGIFSFEDKELKDIMTVLSRWYDMEVVFGDPELEKLEFLGKLKKSQSIEEILNAIKSLSVINTYEIHGKTITLK